MSLPLFDQVLHGLHYMLCAFAVLTGCGPLLVTKGSPEHKFFGLVYLPLSFAALMLASYMAWRESSMVLFCFNSFCAYLLLSGWRAAHEQKALSIIDILIPSGLFLLACIVTGDVMLKDAGLRRFYLLFFAANAFYLSWRDAQHLRQRYYWNHRKIFFADMHFGHFRNDGWLGRHIAGMVGSLLANISVLVLTLLPLSLHFLWPTTLILAGAYIAWKDRQKKLHVRRMQPAFERQRKSVHQKDEPVIRKAA